MTDVKHYAYRVVWSAEDDEYVATVAEFPSLSWVHSDQAKAPAKAMYTIPQGNKPFKPPIKRYLMFPFICTNRPKFV